MSLSKPITLQTALVQFEYYFTGIEQTLVYVEWLGTNR